MQNCQKVTGPKTLGSKEKLVKSAKDFQTESYITFLLVQMYYESTFYF